MLQSRRPFTLRMDIHSEMFSPPDCSSSCIIHCISIAFTLLTTHFPHWQVHHESSAFVVFTARSQLLGQCLAHIRCPFNICRTGRRSCDTEGTAGGSDGTSRVTCHWKAPEGRLTSRVSQKGRHEDVKLRMVLDPDLSALELALRVLSWGQRGQLFASDLSS